MRIVDVFPTEFDLLYLFLHLARVCQSHHTRSTGLATSLKTKRATTHIDLIQRW